MTKFQDLALEFAKLAKDEARTELVANPEWLQLYGFDYKQICLVVNIARQRGITASMTDNEIRRVLS